MSLFPIACIKIRLKMWKHNIYIYKSERKKEGKKITFRVIQRKATIDFMSEKFKIICKPIFK